MRQQKRKALFIGIDEYEGGLQPLSCACNDARDLCEYFKRRGYEAEVLKYADVLGVRQAIMKITADLQPDDVFLLFFAGHGFTVNKDKDEDRRLATSRDVKEQLEDGDGGISLRRLKKLTGKGGYSRIFILDACQTKINTQKTERAVDNSTVEKSAFTQRDLLAISSVVRSKDDSRDTAPFLIINSCDVGDVAYELDHNGLFTKSLIETLDNMEANGESPLFNDDFVARVSANMTKMGNGLRQKPTLIPSDNFGETPLRIFPVEFKYSENVKKMLNGLDDGKYLDVKRFAVDVMLGRAKFRHHEVLRNLLRLISDPSKCLVPIQSDDVALLLEAFFDLKELLEKPIRMPPADDSFLKQEPRKKGINIAEGERISSEDQNSLDELESKLEDADGSDYGISKLASMSCSEAVAELNAIARVRLRKYCSGSIPYRTLYGSNDRAKWKNRADEGLSAVGNAIYEFILDDECLESRRKARG